MIHIQRDPSDLIKRINRERLLTEPAFAKGRAQGAVLGFLAGAVTAVVFAIILLGIANRAI